MNNSKKDQTIFGGYFSPSLRGFMDKSLNCGSYVKMEREGITTYEHHSLPFQHKSMTPL